VKTVALKSEGISQIVENIQLHRNHIKSTGLWVKKMVNRYAKQVKEIILHRQNEVFWNKENSNILDKELSLSHEKRKSPQALAELLFDND
jgi:putative protein kinase ArgK-like GTPase of G3E family